MRRGERREGKLLHFAPGRLALSHEPADGAMCFAKRRAFANEIVGEIGRHHRARERRTHPIRAEPTFGERASDRGQDEEQGVGRVEEHALVVLQILVVARRQSLERREQRREVAEHARRRAARELERIGIPLLRHHARARGVAFAELHEPELARPVDDQVLGQPREMRPDHRRGEQHLGDEVAIAHGVDRVR